MMTQNGLANITHNIASDVLASGLSIWDGSRSFLEQVVSEEHTDDARWRNVNVYFSTNPSNYWDRDARIEVSGETDYSSEVQDPETGDLIVQFKITVTFRTDNISCDSLDEAASKLQLAVQALDLARALKSKYESTYGYVYRTKAQVEAKRAADERLELLNKVKCLTEYPCKGLEVGCFRQVDRRIYAGIPDGQYEVSFADDHDVKTYRVSARAGYVALLRTN
jgi:hypothetical protein